MTKKKMITRSLTQLLYSGRSSELTLRVCCKYILVLKRSLNYISRYINREAFHPEAFRRDRIEAGDLLSQSRIAMLRELWGPGALQRGRRQ